jgi:hypothetical protein
MLGFSKVQSKNQVNFLKYLYPNYLSISEMLLMPYRENPFDLPSDLA